MKEIATIERKKEIYEITPEEFVTGKWLEVVKKLFENGYSFEIGYINNYLTIKCYLFEGDEKKEVNSNDRRR